MGVSNRNFLHVYCFTLDSACLANLTSLDLVEVHDVLRYVNGVCVGG